VKPSSRADLLLAIALTVVGLLEVLLGPAYDGDRLVSALVLPLTTLPLAWRRDAPLLPAAAVATALLVQAPLDGFLVGNAVTPVVAAVLALYAAGRYAAGAGRLAGAALAVVTIVATRTAFDPAVERAGDAVLTLIAVASPLLVGRWVRGQVLLRRELADKSERLLRMRERDALHAAEEERTRIAADLQAAIAGGLHLIVGQAQALPDRVRAQDHAAARALLASIAATAREALADVRRALGILRREGQAPRLAPPVEDPFAAPAAAPDGSAGARRLPFAAAAPAPEPAAAPDGPAAARRLRRAPEGALGRHADLTLVVALVMGGAIELVMAAPAGEQPIAALSALAIAAPLLWRRRRPVTVAAAVLGAVALQSAVLELGSFPVFDIAAVVCAAYAIGAYAERRLAAGGLVLAGLAASAHAAVFYPEGVVAALLGGVVLPWTIGRVVRGHQRLTREVRDKAAQIERARALEARAAVTSERMRVARELHDAVAHNISVIAIQAGGADGIVERDPERAVQCAALIEAVGRDALAELGRLAGAPSDGPASPSLARVDALAQRARDGGLRVELRVEGTPATLPAGVDLAAFRIVQEALANASKHAAASRAWVVVRYEPRAVELEIGDDGRGPDAGPVHRNGSGHGLAGMRERVALYGGTLDAGRRPSGGFAVRARLRVGGT
jgi:signal transduction histidine kinase